VLNPPLITRLVAMCNTESKLQDLHSLLTVSLQ